MAEAILFLTGHIAKPRLEAVLESMQPEFDYEVFDIGVKVAALMTEEIIGLDAAESRDILARIFELQAERRFLYEHVWKVGHLVMWDNRCTTHARTDFDPAEERLLRRVTIGAEAAVPAA